MQNDDGGWGDTPGSPSTADGTGAVMQALSSGSKPADRGLSYLREAQRPGGGFPLGGSGAVNSQSTAWAIQGIIAAGSDPSSFRRGGASAPDYLAAQQASDGHYRYSASSDQTPIWVTGEVLVAAAGKSFPVPVPPRTSRSFPRADDVHAPGLGPFGLGCTGNLRTLDHRLATHSGEGWVRHPSRTFCGPPPPHARGDSPSLSSGGTREGGVRTHPKPSRRRHSRQPSSAIEAGPGSSPWPPILIGRSRRQSRVRLHLVARPSQRLVTAAREPAAMLRGWTSRLRSARAARTRRSAPSRSPREEIEELLELARWAPNHHLTAPWRFRVVGPRALARLKEAAGPEGAAKLDRAPTLIVVSAALGGDPVQDEEDLHATAVASYIVLLAAHARGLAGYWRTPGVAARRGGPRAPSGCPTRSASSASCTSAARARSRPRPSGRPSRRRPMYLD